MGARTLPAVLSVVVLRPVWRRNQFQESPVFPQQEFLGLGEPVVFPSEWILGQSRPIGFVCGQTLDVINPIRQCRRPLVRRKIANQIGAASRNGLAPVSGILGELRLLRGIDMITDETGDHRNLLGMLFR